MPQLSVAQPAATPEGTAVVFNVNLSGFYTEPVTVQYVTNGGTATNGEDYVGASAATELVIPAGQTTGQILIPTVDDVLAEPPGFPFQGLSGPETFNLVVLGAHAGDISNPTPVDVVLDPARDPSASAFLIPATIEDNMPRISVNDVTAHEGDAAITFTWHREGDLSLTSTADFTVTPNGGAINGVDFTGPTAGTITFNPGEADKTLSFAVIDDNVVEGPESFSVNMVNVTNGEGINSESQRIGTILDNNDAPPPQLSINDVTVIEGQNAVFTLSLDKPLVHDLAVNWATQDGNRAFANAQSPNDYTGGSGTTTIPTGQTTATISIPTVQDPFGEASEIFLMNISSVDPSVVVADGTGVATIPPNDLFGPDPEITSLTLQSDLLLIG